MLAGSGRYGAFKDQFVKPGRPIGPDAWRENLNQTPSVARAIMHDLLIFPAGLGAYGQPPFTEADELVLKTL